MDNLCFGLSHVYYGRNNKYTMASEATEITKVPCPTDGCSGFVRARGFCVSCYYRQLRRGAIQSGTSTAKFKHRISNVDNVGKVGDCTSCGRVKVFSRGDGYFRCSIASNERSKKYKAAYRQSKKILLKDKCEICGSKSKLCYDHCHTTGKFRGTLCTKCNVAIGLFADNTNSLSKAIAYLNEFRLM